MGRAHGIRDRPPPSLPARLHREACRRLLAHREELQPLLHGLSVRISDGNRVADDGSYIDVAWDAQL